MFHHFAVLLVSGVLSALLFARTVFMCYKCAANHLKEAQAYNDAFAQNLCALISQYLLFLADCLLTISAFAC